ncbi:MAG: SDR family NAD(P)-dependent oxidoreductase [Verrucomicrobiota bacterium]|jgi:uncharacterized oxidoreductase
MKLVNNTILITGGATGIGRALAEALLAAGNEVIIAGRRLGLLEAVRAANPGMKSAALDITNPESIKQLTENMAREFPRLNVVIQNAGIMRTEVLPSGSVADAEAMVATNLLGPIRLTAALLPALKEQPEAVIMTVSSGMAFLPWAMTPTYSATKAAIHSYTQSLRLQLRDTSVRVLELIPPYVQTELMGQAQAQDMNAMPVRQFVAEVMRILKTNPEATEIRVERVRPLQAANAWPGRHHGGFWRNPQTGFDIVVGQDIG